MTKTSVKFAVAALATCGTLALASLSPVSASDGLELSPDYLPDQIVSQPQDNGAVGRTDTTGLPAVYPDVVDPKETRWMPVIYG